MPSAVTLGTLYVAVRCTFALVEARGSRVHPLHQWDDLAVIKLHVAAAVLSLGQAEVTQEYSGGSSFKCTAEPHKQHVPSFHGGLTGQLRNAPFHQNKNFSS